MSISTGLKLTARRTNSGQFRLVAGARDARHFSHSTSITRGLRRPELHAVRLGSTQQTRSLSLFGWGSSKSSAESTPTHPEPIQIVEAAPSTPTLESIRTVKATHSTSDVPDPTTTSTGGTDALQNIENSVLQSQNTPPSAAAVNDTPDLASIPEGIGYLKDVCGLDFGWGPTALMQFLLEHIHITAGLSWSTSIIVLAFLLRSSIFPLAVTASDTTARFQEYSPLLKQIQAKSKEALANNDRTAVLEAQMQMRELKKEGKFSFNKMFRPMLLQFPLGYGAWHLMRTSSSLPVPGFENENWLWLSSLAVGDPWYILPFATAAMTWLNLSSSAKAQPSTAQMPGLALIRNVFPVFTGVFLLFQPACVQIYFLTNGFLTQLQFTSLQSPAFRKLLKLHPMPNRNPTPGHTPASHMNTAPKTINTTARTTTASTPGTATTRSPTSSPSPATNRSFIDQGVDSIKSSSQQVWQKAIGSTKEKRDEKVLERKRQALKDAATRYEAQRKQDLESLRSSRNAAQGGQNHTRKR